VEALERFSAAANAFDLVITDLTMPRMTGKQFAQAVHALRPDIPVILITGNATGLTRQGLRELGIFDLLHKPISRQAMMTMMRRALAVEPRAREP
jgi:DNA-binding NtrC family response regulator